VQANSPLILRAALNLIALAVTHLKAVSSREESMKIALPALPGSALVTGRRDTGHRSRLRFGRNLQNLAL
jgi:hypothetical protein